MRILAKNCYKKNCLQRLNQRLRNMKMGGKNDFIYTLLQLKSNKKYIQVLRLRLKCVPGSKTAFTINGK